MAHAYCRRAIDGREKQVLANVWIKEPRGGRWRCAGWGGVALQVCPGRRPMSIVGVGCVACCCGPDDRLGGEEMA